MTHLLPHHAELPPADQPLPPAYATDAGNQPLVEPPPQLPTPAATSGRKRKKQDAGKDDVPHTPAEPRRLRRSHEVSVDRTFTVRVLPNLYASVLQLRTPTGR
jgi:hypothetical protein